MKIEDAVLLPIVPDPKSAVWREADDPFGYTDADGCRWIIFREGERLVRAKKEPFINRGWSNTC